MLVFSREVLYFPLVLISVDISNIGEGISQSFNNHHESIIARKERGVLDTKYPSFKKKKKLVDDLLNDRSNNGAQNFRCL